MSPLSLCVKEAERAMRVRAAQTLQSQEWSFVRLVRGERSGVRVRTADFTRSDEGYFP